MGGPSAGILVAAGGSGDVISTNEVVAGNFGIQVEGSAGTAIVSICIMPVCGL